MYNINNKYSFDKAPAVSVGGLYLTRTLALGGVPVIAATSIANRTVFNSKLKCKSYEIPGPTKTPVDFIQALVNIGRELSEFKPALYYDGDADLLCISRNRKDLESYYRFNMPPDNVVEALVDKALFFGYAKKYELPIPYTLLLEGNENTVKNVEEKFAFPVIVKPVSRVNWFDTPLAKTFGKGGKAILVKSKNELSSIISISKEHKVGIIIQELISGSESEIVSYHSYVSREGKILGEYTGRKHRTFPNRFGMSTCVEVYDLPEVYTAGKKIIEKTGLFGVSKIDFKKDPVSGNLYLLEINPRFNLWNYPAAVAGVNLPEISYSDITNSTLKTSARVSKNIFWIDGKLDRLALKESGHGILNYSILWLKYLFSNTVYKVWAWNDPLPFIIYIYSRIQEMGNSILKRIKLHLLSKIGKLLKI